MNFGSALEQVHRRAPLVDCITNFVTVNDCANILLAVGGSPTMASDIREVQETAAAASALLCNLGAIDKVESMILGGQAANRAGKPVVFDPVGAGNTSLRRAESARLLDAVQFAVIRGNASEIRALAQRRAAGSGSASSASPSSTRTGCSPSRSSSRVTTITQRSQTMFLIGRICVSSIVPWHHPPGRRPSVQRYVFFDTPHRLYPPEWGRTTPEPSHRTGTAGSGRGCQLRLPGMRPPRPTA